MYGVLGSREKASAVANRERRDPIFDFSKLKRGIGLLSRSSKKLAIMLTSGNGGLREEATERLVKRGADAAPVIRLAMAYGDVMSRAAAAEALCRIIEKKSFSHSNDLVIGSLLDPSPYVVWRALAHLGNKGAKSNTMLGLIRTNLNDENGVVRFHAAQAFGRIRAVRMIETLESALKREQETYVTVAILEAIETLCRHKEAHPDYYRER